MKRVFLSMVAIAGIALVSCKKTDDPVTPAEPGTCTISGTVHAPLDLSNDTTAAGTYIYNLNPEDVTSGIITFVVDSEDLDHNPDDDYIYKDLSFSASISGGEYSVEVPAISTPLTVDVYVDDFNADQRQYIAGNPDSVVYENMMFSAGSMSLGGITEGASRVLNIEYGDM
ncbi:hypothetical protein [Crocinitomix algicola]|uniref:hypothetical protein n=1 Tax=Crocinitomix algicola TaxID=1740263 RepID=UPI0008362C25|nr:hypothetical protein [Crocinitomix algicola]